MRTPEQIDLWHQAAEQGNLYGRFVLGTLYATGDGLPRDPVRAHWYFESATGTTDIAKDSYVGSMYAQGRVIPADDREAVVWIKKDVAKGLPEAQILLGAVYFRSLLGMKQNTIKAVTWFLKAAKQGHARAQDNAGSCYAAGVGVEKNDAEAIKWCRLSAEQGYAPAQYGLGKFYAQGRGVEKNEAEAVVWFLKAAEQGYLQAQNSLQACYYHGRGVAKDIQAADYWSEKSMWTVWGAINTEFWSLYRRHIYDRAEETAQRSLHFAEIVSDSDTLRVATSLDNLGCLYTAQGHYAKAEPFYLRVLEIREKIFGREHLKVVPSLKRLASFYCKQGQHEKAQPFFDRVNAIMMKAIGSDHSDRATFFESMATAYGESGQHMSAKYFETIAADHRANNK